jgi:transglutaminase-like putative cysteine protease
LRDKLRNVSLLALLIISFLLMSIAIDSLGEVPKYVPLPRPPFVNQSGDFRPGIIDGDIPIGWDESPTLAEEDVTQIDASCGCERNPLFNITGVTGTQYLRVKLGESYDGEWLMYNLTSHPYAGEAINAKIGEARKIYISPEGSFEGYIPAMKNTQQLAGTPNLEYFPEKMIFHSNKKVEREYEISYNIKAFNPDKLTKEYLSYNAGYLQVPYDVQVAVENMTKDIVAGIDSSYLKIKTIESYLKDNYVYNLNYTRSPDDIDPVRWFLFESKEGVCIHYNSALVLMARSMGLPMRLVTGYRIDPDKHIQTVTPQQAHAWAEANFEDLGWVTFDATGREQDAEEESEDHGELIPTNTSIIYQDSSCYKNNKFIVTGRVTDPDGKPVNGLTTLIYLVTKAPEIVLSDNTWVVIQNNTGTVIWDDIKIDTWDEADKELFLDGILCGKTVSIDDQFNVNCTIPLNTQPSDYGVKAITLGNSFYEGSNTDPPIDVLARSTIECNTSFRVISGRSFTIEGKLLEEETGIPLSVHDLDVIPEEGSYSSLFVNDEGIFRYNHVFEPGAHKIILYWEGTSYYNGSRKILNVTSIPLSVDPDPIDYLVRGEANHITGKVHAEELIPDPGEQVEIYLDDEFIGTATTGENGFFRHSYAIPDSTAVGEVQLSYYFFDDALRGHATSQHSSRPSYPELSTPWSRYMEEALPDRGCYSK